MPPSTQPVISVALVERYLALIEGPVAGYLDAMDPDTAEAETLRYVLHRCALLRGRLTTARTGQYVKPPHYRREWP